jgi:hypothetical protein
MLWVDGNLLVFHEGTWMYRSEVSYYQFSLCMEAGACMPEDDERQAVENALLDPDLSSAPMQMGDAQIVQPNCAQEYCAWAGGRSLTEAEIASIGVDSGLPRANSFAPASDHGFRCAVDSPHPMAAACETSAFYLNGPPAPMEHAVVQLSQFCQNGQGYATGDVDLAGGVIQSVTGGSANCQQADGNTVVCSGAPGSSVGGEVLMQCDELPAVQDNGLPAVQDNGLPAAGQLQCQPGYDFNGDSPAQCTFSAPAQSRIIQPAERARLVVFQATPPSPSDCPPHYEYDAVRGVCVAVPTCLNGMVWDPATETCREPGSSGHSCDPGWTYSEALGRCIQVMLPICPVGTYYDAATGTCVAPAPPPWPNIGCLAGYRFDDGARCCQSTLPSGDYPGCPPGQAYDQLTGACDAENIWTANAEVLHTVEFTLNLPSCENGGGGGPGTTGGSACKGLPKDKCYATAGCKWDGNSSTCN